MTTRELKDLIAALLGVLTGSILGAVIVFFMTGSTF